MAVYAVSDIHGHKDIFEKGLEKIGFSKNDTLYILGDMIDRGPDGIAILQMVMKNPNMHCLFGNHELLMVDAICHHRDFFLWALQNGGHITNNAFQALSKEQQCDIIDYLLDLPAILPVCVDNKDYILLHSSYHKDYENVPICQIPYNILYDLVWCSPYRDAEDGTFVPLQSYEKGDVTFIAGHVPVQRIVAQDTPANVNPGHFLAPVQDKNLIVIDGGCAFGKMPLLNGLIFYKLGQDTYETVTL